MPNMVEKADSYGYGGNYAGSQSSSQLGAHEAGLSASQGEHTGIHSPTLGVKWLCAVVQGCLTVKIHPKYLYERANGWKWLLANVDIFRILIPKYVVCFKAQ